MRPKTPPTHRTCPNSMQYEFAACHAMMSGPNSVHFCLCSLSCYYVQAAPLCTRNVAITKIRQLMQAGMCHSCQIAPLRNVVLGSLNTRQAFIATCFRQKPLRGDGDHQ